MSLKLISWNLLMEMSVGLSHIQIWVLLCVLRVCRTWLKKERIPFLKIWHSECISTISMVTRVPSLGYEFKEEAGGASSSSSWILHGDALKSLLLSDFLLFCPPGGSFTLCRRPTCYFSEKKENIRQELPQVLASDLLPFVLPLHPVPLLWRGFHFLPHFQRPYSIYWPFSPLLFL